MKLDSIADHMRSSINDRRAKSWAQRTLPRGLRLVLSRRDGRYRLALGREDVYPSLDEITICSQAFGVPPGTEPRRFTVQARTKTGAFVPLYAIELTWREIEESSR